MKKIIKFISKLFNKKDVILTAQSTFYFQPNDNTTPNLAFPISSPEIPNKLSFQIIQRKSLPFPGHDVMNRNTQCIVAMCNSIKFAQSIVTKFRQPIDRWKATNKLNVFPHAGQDYNAYYDRTSLRFFYGYNSKRKRACFTCASSDVVCHELGHALLDCLRPDLWDIPLIEVGAFHESFGDMHAFLTLLSYDNIVKNLSDCDLYSSNFASKFAEEFSNTLYDIGASNLPILRDACNSYNYINPAKLPDDSNNDADLTTELHNFSRVFTGAFYSFFLKVYEKELHQGAEIAIKIARDVCAFYLYKAVTIAPRVNDFYHAMAKAMLSVDTSRNNPYQNELQKVFTERNILKKEVKMLSNKKWADIRSSLERSDIVYKNNEAILTKLNRGKTKKLGEYLVQSQSIDGFDLANLEFEIPLDKFYILDKNGNVVDYMEPNEDEIINSTIKDISRLVNKKQIGPNDDTLWEIKDNKLVRSLICTPSSK